jgi:hypothetical protein
MKRLAIALSILILLTMLSPAVLAQPTHPPHQNPATAEDSPGLVSLPLFYGNVFATAVIGQYQDAQSMLKELAYAHIPDELRYIIDRYNSLSRQLITILDNLELLLYEASTLLADYQISAAKQKLDAAEAAIPGAQLILEEIEATTTILSDRLGVLAPLAGTEIRQAYDRLVEMQHRLRQRIDELNQLRQSLAQRQEIQAVELIPTKLSLSITPASVFVGDSITVSGRLTADRSPLANRKLTLLLDDEPLLAITTDLDGSYVTDITIPYIYVSTMTLRAIYIPAGNDIGIYQGSQSPPVIVNTSFYPTLLEASAPETAHPGLPITISGHVSSTDGPVDRIIKVLLDNTQLAEEITEGQFSLQIALPPQIPTGEHNLTVVAAPQKRYSGASTSLSINISRLPIQADIKVPLLIAIPRPIQISGKVYHNRNPIQDAQVNLTFGDLSATVRTATDGSFTTTVDIPLDLFLVGPQELIITIEPVEPWYASLQIKRGIFTINPANIGLLLVAVIPLGLLIFSGVRTRPPSRREKMVTPEARRPEPPTVAPPLRPKHELTGIKDRILSAYLNGLEAVEKVTSIPMLPHTSLREFVNAATPQLPTAIKPFTELTTIAEIALYSAHRLDEDTATRAEQLATTITEELRSGTA